MKLKKVLSLLLIFILVFSSISMVFADEAIKVVDEKNAKVTKDEAKTIALKFFTEKMKMKIDEKKFQSNIELVTDYEEQDQYVWNISMYSSDVVKHVSLNATVNANTGEIIRINKYEHTQNTKPTVATITEDEAFAIAKKFISEIHGDIESELKYIEDKNMKYMYKGQMSEYNFRYIRIINGVEFENNYVTIGVDGVTGNINSYGYTWTDKNKVQFPSADGLMDSKGAEELIKSDVQIMLSYRPKRVLPHYSYMSPMDDRLVYTAGELLQAMVDAKTGNLIDWNGKAKTERIKKEELSIEKKNAIYKKAVLKIEPTKELKEEEARIIIDKEIEKLFGKGFKINNMRYTEGDFYETSGKKGWIADFVNENKGKYMLGGTVGINALNGKIIFANNWNNNDQNQEFEPTLKWNEAYDKAISYIADYFPEHIKSIKTEQIYEQYPYYVNGKSFPQRFYNFFFQRVEENIVITDNYICIGFDAKTGMITELRCMWDDKLTLPKQNGVIDKKTVQNIVFSNFKPTLQYVRIYTNDENGKPQNEIKLVYRLSKGYPFYFWGIDAYTGKFLDYEGKVMPTDGEADFDKKIKDSKVKRELSILATQGILDRENFDINKTITKIEAIKMLVMAKSNIYYEPINENELLFTNIKKDDNNYTYLSNAIRFGLIENEKVEFKYDEKIKREEFAELVIKLIGHDEAAKAKDIFKLDFSDTESIDSNRFGHVALCKGLGIMDGKNGKFLPKAELSMEEAALAIYRAIDKIKEVRY